MDDKAERSRRVREALHGRTVQWFASALGCALSTAHSYMDGNEPKAATALKVADVLDIDYRWYVTGQGEPKAPVRAVAAVVHVPLLRRDFTQEGTVAYTQELLDSLKLPDVGQVRCIMQPGPAMRPTIPVSAEVLYAPIGPEGIEDGGVYVIAAGNQAIVRRLRLSPAGAWHAVCDNRAFEGEKELAVNPRSVVGAVVWTSHKV